VSCHRMPGSAAGKVLRVLRLGRAPALNRLAIHGLNRLPSLENVDGCDGLIDISEPETELEF